MRDPKRIERILKLTGRVWKKHPDLRLCQLLENYYPGKHCLYYVEDSELEEKLSGS